ncbi:hypothetical protein AB8810_12925 [Xanthomonas sp. NCPPB 3005]|uniref:hypothetical protein n=1 Tax=Xanthomonas sp. NCPPB 3005 TaxID=3240913 RepID=UPI003512C113
MSGQTKAVDVLAVWDAARAIIETSAPAHMQLQPGVALEARAAIAELIEKGAAYRKAELACSEDHVGYRRLFDALQVARAEFTAALARCGATP